MLARSVDLRPSSLSEFAQMFEADVRPVLRKERAVSGETTTRIGFTGHINQFREFACECWQRMRQMNAEFERSNRHAQ
jgi:hypothetical protein